MIRFYIEATDITTSVRKPVIKSLVEDLAAVMGIEQELVIRYSGTDRMDDMQVRRGDGLLGRNHDAVAVNVDASVEYTDNTMSQTSNRPMENTHIFHDPQLGVGFAPTYARSLIRFQLGFEFPSKNAAEMQMSRFRQLASQQNRGMIHELKYDYIIPEFCIGLLHEVWTKREAVAGYGDTFKEYLDKHFRKTVGTKSNQAGTHVTFTVNEQQQRVLGFYEFEIAPEKPEAGEDRTKYILKLNYRVEYDEILSFHMAYPLVIHNQPINPLFYETAMPYTLAQRPSDPGFTVAALDFYTKNNDMLQYHKGIPVPLFDQWMPLFRPDHHRGILKILHIFDEENRVDLMDVADIDTHVALTDSFVNYMIAEREHVVHQGGAAVFLALYRHNELVKGDRYRLDCDGHLRLNEHADLRTTYRTWVALHTDPLSLGRAAIERMAKHGDFCIDYLLWFNPAISTVKPAPGAITPNTTRDTGYRVTALPQIKEDGSVDVNELTEALHLVTRQRLPTNGTPFKAADIRLMIKGDW